jgi:trehalose synthase
MESVTRARLSSDLFERVEVPEGYRLRDYAEYADLAPHVMSLEAAARNVVPQLAGRTIWMVSSTHQGGGVAEGLPRVISLMRQLGVSVEWVVIHPPDPAFFPLTKRLHNQLHGVDTPALSPSDRELYDVVSDRLSSALAGVIARGDILVVHDPQPLGAGARVRRRLDVRTVWRCHIGFDRKTRAGDDAWRFLKTDVLAYDRSVFTLKDYVPPFLSGKAVVMSPTIDPLTHKNRELSVHKTAGILVDAALVAAMHPAIAPPFKAPAQRLQADGRFAPATFPEDIGLLFRPIVTQISRWDSLKGFAPLLEAFALLKGRQPTQPRTDRHQRCIDHARLVLAGPDPAGVADDPEAEETLDELCRRWIALPVELQREVALLKLPLVSTKENALMVNALQRCSTIVVQNSIREGFGLTVAEAMWKARPVLGGATPGIKAQIADEITGRLVTDPENPEAVANVLDAMLAHGDQPEAWGRNARLKVTREFLVFGEVRHWLELLMETVSMPALDMRASTSGCDAG